MNVRIRKGERPIHSSMSRATRLSTFVHAALLVVLTNWGRKMEKNGKVGWCLRLGRLGVLPCNPNAEGEYVVDPFFWIVFVFAQDKL